MSERKPADMYAQQNERQAEFDELVGKDDDDQVRPTEADLLAFDSVFLPGPVDSP